MTTVVLKDEWREEADSWNENGDPPFNPPSNPQEGEARHQEMIEKQASLRDLEANLEEAYAEMFEELTGIPIKAGVAGGGTITAAEILRRVREKHGEEAAEALQETLEEALEEELRDSDIVDHHGNPFRVPVNKKDIAKKVGKKLSKKLVAGGLVGALLALLELAILIEILWRISGIESDLETLRRAIRYEFLEITDVSDEYTHFLMPDAQLAETLVENPRCRLHVKITFRWIDSESGELRTHETDEVAAQPSTEETGRFDHSLEWTVPDTACHLESLMVWRLICDTDPPMIREVFRGVRHWRTNADCEKQKGKLIWDG